MISFFSLSFILLNINIFIITSLFIHFSWLPSFLFLDLHIDKIFLFYLFIFFLIELLFSFILSFIFILQFIFSFLHFLLFILLKFLLSYFYHQFPPPLLIFFWGGLSIQNHLPLLFSVRQQLFLINPTKNPISQIPGKELFHLIRGNHCFSFSKASGFWFFQLKKRKRTKVL